MRVQGEVDRYRGDRTSPSGRRAVDLAPLVTEVRSRRRLRPLDELGTRRWGSNEPHLDLAMAVCANQDALASLRLVGRQCFPSAHAHPEGLRLRIDVMKVQVHDAPGVAADGAAASRLLDQEALHLLVPARDGLTDAALALPAETHVCRSGSADTRLARVVCRPAFPTCSVRPVAFRPDEARGWAESSWGANVCSHTFRTAPSLGAVDCEFCSGR